MIQVNIVGRLRVVEHLLLKCGVLPAVVLVCVAADLDFQVMLQGTQRKQLQFIAVVGFVHAQEWRVTHTIYVLADAESQHI
jgi:Na+-transporting methylmalonyl-CoA/oxaloacetate decarboxylase beta subunit